MICNNKSIRDGTNQLERQSEFLKEGFVKIDERSHGDLLDFLHGLSSELAFYDLNFQSNVSWQHILNDLQNLPNLDPPENADEVPHLGLLIALTKLFGFAQDEINKISQNHLNYYYKEVLKIQSKKATPDQVQLILNLTKSNSFDEFLLKEGTDFDAGKDSNKNQLIYKTDKESVISRAAIEEIKTLFLDEKNGHIRIQAAPVANSLDGLGEPLDETISFWPTFGESQLENAIENRTMVDASIGFAISSSILLLKEGDRTIDVDINFHPITITSGLTSLSNGFEIQFSTTEGWAEPIIYSSTLLEIDPVEHIWQLQIRIELDPAEPPFDFNNPEVHIENYPVQSPILKLNLKPDSHGYETLKHLKVETVDVAVEAKGMKDHLLQNNTGVLKPESPFLPFGAQPVLGNSLYIGNAEIFRKKLHELSISLSWHDIPAENLADHYAEYSIDTGFNNDKFQADIDLLLNKSWGHRLKSNKSIFNSVNAEDINEIKIETIEFENATALQSYAAQLDSKPISPWNVQTDRDFIRIILSNPKSPFKGFGHKEFTPLYTERAIALATYDATAPGPPPVPVLPNQPYTPTLKELSLSYKSKITIEANAQNEVDKLFQIAPFGFRQIDSNFNGELVPVIEEEGALILGLSGFSAPQTINLLFNLEEGTAKRSVILPSENINWNYLSENRWIPLSQQEVLADGTSGFKQSGIISLTIPKDASNSNTLLPTDKFWIKATISEGAEGAHKTKNIYANAVNATLNINNTNFDKHLSKPLEIDKITGLLKKVKEIKKVEQPLISNNGYPGETNIVFNSRVSERLRHKNRSTNLWDYEHMVLEAFPNIFKVKCLNHTSPDSNNDAGAVTLIVVSNLRNQDASNPFEPSTSKLVLEQIKAFIQKYISPFAKMFVELPIYESILVEAKIGFHEGFDPGFYSNLLNEELKQFLSPWAFIEGFDIEIGGSIYKSTILQFIETRKYVDYVVDFKIYHQHGGYVQPGIGEMEIALDFEVAKTISPGIGEMAIGSTYVVGEDVNVACATSSRSILVSASDHRIEALRPNEFVCDGASSLGISFMTVNLDLVVEV